MDEADETETFECVKCGAIYRGSYRIGITVHTGHFDCQVCRAHVHKWQGVRDYFKWERT
jgi:transcription elongation factor Elf1